MITERTNVEIPDLISFVMSLVARRRGSLGLGSIDPTYFDIDRE